MKLDLTPDHYIELIKKSYSLDAIYLLNLISEEFDVTPLIEGSAKVKAIHSSLIRKGMITEEEKLTTLGLDLIEFVSKKTNKKFIKKKVARSDFDDWWELYPTTDEFKMGHKVFKGSRGLHSGKEKCRLLFNKIIDEGIHSKEDLMRALAYEVKMRKSNSLKKNKNELSWMKATESYLNSQGYDSFIKISKESTIDAAPIGSIDV